MTNRGGRVMVFKATFNNISVISWQSVLLVKETRFPRKAHWPTASHLQTMLYRVDLVWMELELNIIVVLDTHYI